MNVDTLQRYQKGPEHEYRHRESNGWEQEGEIRTQTGRWEMYTYQDRETWELYIKGIHQEQIVDIGRIVYQLRRHKIEYQLRIHVHETYICTRLATGHENIEIKIREREGDRQAIQIRQWGARAEIDYQEIKAVARLIDNVLNSIQNTKETPPETDE